jgi:hypothetical protein
MAARNTLKYKRNKSPSLIELVDKLIKRSVDALENGEIKATVSDLIRIVHLRRKLFPVPPAPVPVTWIDGWSPDGQDLYSPPNQKVPPFIPA